MRRVVRVIPADPFLADRADRPVEGTELLVHVDGDEIVLARDDPDHLRQGVGERSVPSLACAKRFFDFDARRHIASRSDHLAGRTVHLADQPEPCFDGNPGTSFVAKPIGAIGLVDGSGRQSRHKPSDLCQILRVHDAREGEHIELVLREAEQIHEALGHEGARVIGAVPDHRINRLPVQNPVSHRLGPKLLVPVTLR